MFLHYLVKYKQNTHKRIITNILTNKQEIFQTNIAVNDVHDTSLCGSNAV